MMVAPCLRADVTDRSSNVTASSTQPALAATGPQTSWSIFSRSSVENSGFLPGWTPIATTSLSHSDTLCRTTSRWPLVMGSKEPG